MTEPSGTDEARAREVLACEYDDIGDSLNANRIRSSQYVCEEVDVALRAIRRAFANEQASAQAIPAGMKAWAGGDSAPDDYGGRVRFRDGNEDDGDDPEVYYWKHDGDDDTCDIIAYTPKASAQGVGEVERRCSVCTAIVASYPEGMCCHCHELPWPLATPEGRVSDEVALRAVIHNDALLFAEIETRMRECWIGTGKLMDEGSASNDFRVWMNEAHNRQRDLKAALGQHPNTSLAALNPTKGDAK